MTRVGVSLGLLAIGLVGCDEQAGPIVLRDTEGRLFSMSCEASTCTYHRTLGEPISKEKSGLELRTAGRVVGMCDVEPTGTPEIADCRALVCKTDRECPPMHGLEAGHCVNGVCTSPDKNLVEEDAVLLCLAGTGLGRNAPKQVERYALAMNCGKPCVVPAPCRQP